MKTLSKAIAIASLVSAGALTAQVANAEVEYSAQIDSSYLYRGENIGGNAALFSGAVDYSHDSGFYAGAWIANSPEYDLYAGYAMEVGEVSIDLGAVTYVYPGTGAGQDTAPFDGMEAYINLGFMGASLSYNTGFESLEDKTYLAIGYELDAVSLTYGMVDGDTDGEYTHFDIAFGLNEELSLTLSTAMDDDDNSYGIEEDTQVILTYALPIK
jgi:uncharacterized protein (TIGR02001 family)